MYLTLHYQNRLDRLNVMDMVYPSLIYYEMEKELEFGIIL